MKNNVRYIDFIEMAWTARSIVITLEATRGAQWTSQYVFGRNSTSTKSGLEETVPCQVTSK